MDSKKNAVFHLIGFGMPVALLDNVLMYIHILGFFKTCRTLFRLFAIWIKIEAIEV